MSMYEIKVLVRVGDDAQRIHTAEATFTTADVGENSRTITVYWMGGDTFSMHNDFTGEEEWLDEDNACLRAICPPDVLNALRVIEESLCVIADVDV